MTARLLAILACLLLAPAAGAQAGGDAASTERPWRVVLIRNWDSMYPVNVMREQALRGVLLEQGARSVEIYPEEMDPLRFPAGTQAELATLLQRKYEATAVDLVIASGQEPLDFAAQHRDLIWPGVPIVFHGVVDGTLDENWRRPPRTTGITMKLDVEGTLALGMALVPRARKVYLVSGNAPFDRSYLQYADRVVRRFEKPLEPVYLAGLSQEEMLDQVAEAGPDSFVVYLTVLRDGAGRIAGPGSDFLRRVAARSPAPVFSAVHTQFGRGPVGGSSARFDLHGRMAGQLARRILEGEDPDRIPVRADPVPACEVDWKALEHWGLPGRSIPARCTVINRTPSAWETSVGPTLLLLAIIVLQGALLSALVIQSIRRRRAEAMLQARSAEMAQVARMSMVGALTASIAHEINQPMGAILSNTEAAEMMLQQGTLDPEKLRDILADIRTEDLRASEVIRSLRKLLARREWNPVSLDVNAEVAEALRHVAFDAAGRGVRITPNFAPALPTVAGDAVQLQQVVINLVVNAMEAIAALPEAFREVRIETRPAGSGVEIAVADRGYGVPAASAKNLFETTFTTKRDGMGFGLSIVRTIVEMHRGRISHEPNKPQGAIFRAWIPAIGA